jgi:hypothetical protein
MYNPLGRYYGDLTVPSFYPVALSNLALDVRSEKRYSSSSSRR